MKLKNYTSETPAENSVMRIERQLISILASNFSKNYKDLIQKYSLEAFNYKYNIS